MGKVCPRCTEYKPYTEYNKNNFKRDGFQNYCRSCSRKSFQDSYKGNKEYYKNRNNALRRSVRGKLKDFLKDKECCDCHIRDYRVLEFDHLKNKRDCVSTLYRTGRCWKTVLAEIQKCEIVCANCHRIRTYNRMHKCWRKDGVSSSGKMTVFETVDLGSIPSTPTINHNALIV